jgi:hypothetical protein
VRTRRRLIPWAALFVLVLLVVPMPAGAFELSAGASLGRIVVGTVPHLAVGPHASISWRKESGFLFAVHDMCSILPPINNAGVGVYNQTTVSIGYASEKVTFSAGPSLSIYSMSACGVTLCGRVGGVAPGGRAQTSYYFAGPLGVSLSGSVDWIGGRSFVLPGGVAAMVVVGPVLRWSTRRTR